MNSLPIPDFSRRIYPFSSTLLFLSLLAGILSSCQPDTDLEMPNITILRSLPTPAPDTICGQEEPVVYRLISGDTLELDLLFEDNEELSQFKLDIHANFDCHGHARMASNTQDWTVLLLEDLSGASMAHSVRLALPENPTSGTYHFQMQVVDRAGNSEAAAYVYSIIVHNTDDLQAPQISLSVPEEGSSMDLNRGDVLSVRGMLTDNRPLGMGGNATVKLSYVRLATGNINTALELQLPSDAGTEYPIEIDYSIPGTWIPGPYLFRLQGWDGVNNASSILEWTVNVGS